MARLKKTLEVKKFGGVDDLGSLKDERKVDFHSELSNETSQHKDVNYDMKSLETQSKTTLEMDEGHGEVVVLRRFIFGMNPVAFAQMKPTKQQLFNSHLKGIEMALWKDGFTIMDGVEPRLAVEGDTYSIFVTAKPMRGRILKEKPRTLSEIAHG